MYNIFRKMDVVINIKKFLIVFLSIIIIMGIVPSLTFAKDNKQNSQTIFDKYPVVSEEQMRKELGPDSPFGKEKYIT